MADRAIQCFRDLPVRSTSHSASEHAHGALPIRSGVALAHAVTQRTPISNKIRGSSLEPRCARKFTTGEMIFKSPNSCAPLERKSLHPTKHMRLTMASLALALCSEC
eukprot:4325797-Amphidinium_carterae.1